MSNLMLKKEIRRIVRESGYKKDKKMLSSILKILQMENLNKNINISQATCLVREVLN